MKQRRSRHSVRPSAMRLFACLVTCALLISIAWPGYAQTPPSRSALIEVVFIWDSISQKDDRVIRVLSGSRWLLSRSTLALATTDVVIVLTDRSKGVLFAEGDEIPVTYLGGSFVPERGRYGRVVESISDGAVLRLNDGSLWSVPSYDRYYTGWWLPPYPVIITGNELYMINLKNGKRVWVKRVQ